QLSPAGRALEPVISELGRWGMRWIFDALEDDELNAIVLLGHMAALLKVEELPTRDTVLQFTFIDFAESPQRYIFVHDGKREVCDINPGHEVDVFIRGSLRALSEVFWGERDLRQAISEGAVKLVGPSAYTRSVSRWFPVSTVAGEQRLRRSAGSRSKSLRQSRSC
ncbi:MAG TPA: hypothetical protein VLD39_06635, partial [Gammaproteobacteria bacterium]|nr:hypothetical protein [Gammaproteobacteria bacterium]